MKNNICMGIFKFDKIHFNLFDKQIYPLIKSLGFICQDARDFYESKKNKMDFIKDMIRDSDLMIIDISEENPNVFFEYGIAYYLDKPIIKICTENSKKNIWNNKFPFDILGKEILFFEKEDDLKQKILNCVFDSYYTAKVLNMNWISDGYLNINKVDEILINDDKEIWNEISIQSNFIISFQVEILSYLPKKNIDNVEQMPDIRFYVAKIPNFKDPNIIKAFPRICIIYPWEYNAHEPFNSFECHINLQQEDDSKSTRLQGACVTDSRFEDIKNGIPFKHNMIISFVEPNIMVQSSEFNKDIERLHISFNTFKVKGYSFDEPNYIGFQAINCKAKISNIKLKGIYDAKNI